MSREDAFLRALLLATPDAVLVVDGAGVVQEVAGGAPRMFGCDTDGLVGGDLADLVSDRDRPELADAATFTGGVDRGVDGVRRDGSHFPADLVIRPTGDGRFVALFRDASARRTAEEIVRATRWSLITQTVSGLAHEVNQPLAAIAAYARAASRILRSRGDVEPRVEQALDGMHEQALRAAGTIERVQAMVDRYESERETVELRRVVEDAVKLAEAIHGRDGLAIEVEIPPALPRVVVDVPAIQQVILDLVRNAVEATPPGDRNRVVVAAHVGDGGFVEVAVTDRGCGVPPDVGDEVFDPFYTTKESSSGMGLSVSSSIVASHGGELSYTRNEPAGTTFHFTLPPAVEVRDAP